MLKKSVLFVSLFLLLLSGLIPAAEQAPPKGNIVYIDKVVAKPGESFAVKVMISNVDTLAGAQVPIFFRNDKIKLVCDSVSFAGGVCENFMFHDMKIPLTCPKCGAKYDMYDAPPKQPGICDKDGATLVESDQAVFFMTIQTIDPKKDVPPIFPGTGYLATIYFTVPKDAPAGIVKLTRGMIPNPNASLVFSVWNIVGDDLKGQFQEGEIEIK
jgi:hypothetical protein